MSSQSKKSTRKKSTPKTSKFSIDQIKEAWQEYETKDCLRVLKDGNWQLHPVEDGLRNIDGVRAEVVKFRSIMSFPNYIEKFYGGKIFIGHPRHRV